MDVLDLLSALGVGLALGIRPLLPFALVGLLAILDLGVDFEGTDFDWLEGPVLVIPLLIGVAVLIPAVLARIVGVELVVGSVVGALFAALAGAAILADHDSSVVVGAVVGIAGALVAAFCVAGLLTRVRARLDEDAQTTLPLFAEGAALLVALLSVVAPPVSVLVLVGVLVLAVRGRRREGEKHAGLRVLR